MAVDARANGTDAVGKVVCNTANKVASTIARVAYEFAQQIKPNWFKVAKAAMPPRRDATDRTAAAA